MVFPFLSFEKAHIFYMLILFKQHKPTNSIFMFFLLFSGFFAIQSLFDYLPELEEKSPKSLMMDLDPRREQAMPRWLRQD